MILAVVQARMSSKRLPGKVLLPLVGKPMIVRQLERIQRCKMINHIVVATSTHESDDPLVQVCLQHGIDVYRGSLKDVLERFYFVYEKYRPEHIVRLTADCPLIDPTVIDKVVQFHLEGRYDYTSNVLPPTFPDGLDVEVFVANKLTIIYEKATLQSEREHVTPFFYKNEHLFCIGRFCNNKDLSTYRWTVDEQEDYFLVKSIYEELYPTNPYFLMEDILGCLDRHPNWLNVNSQYWRNEGYEKSLQADQYIK
ncbi:spore coat polysaccharide biosynthesis protein SpsF [Anoxybacillus voinovskiensis]|uniref:Spore coat polysaccharide biosynthesis protein SpsF n=1 Tax=Anoxybacteroides voinovskiense TaxID=230470 RepID=A0A840DXH2_9BACL|nr:glycosyltransferase family protein [Anoxybacillus voinovskiensis]MBB4073746.1 spore coat polysaccharide biosynthesis protein SpsF [Anoxybacillus voinovskiensis]GGJ64228.1 spore coat protein [Anoxybacillus voinovskiensis]